MSVEDGEIVSTHAGLSLEDMRRRNFDLLTDNRELMSALKDYKAHCEYWQKRALDAEEQLRIVRHERRSHYQFQPQRPSRVPSYDASL